MMLENQHGESLRVGKAGVQRTLMTPVETMEEGKKDFASVRCDEKDVYICRKGAGQRSCTFTVIWWTDKDDDESEKLKEFKFAERDKAIALFLKLVKKLYE